MRTYVLSQDAHLLMRKWAEKQGFIIPAKEYFSDITREIAKDIQSLFDGSNEDVGVEIISADSMILGVNDIMQGCGNDFVISLDRAYFDYDFHVDLSRAVAYDYENESFIDLGTHPRVGCGPLDDQIREALNAARGRAITIVDDGCWTGGSLKRIVQKFWELGVSINKIVVGIIREQKAVDLPIDAMVSIEAVLRFQETQILDWVCERDFIPGMPYGGKTVLDAGSDNKYNIGAYYLLGMGDFKKWASFDFDEASMKWFTWRRLHQAMVMFATISALSGRTVLFSDLERIPFGLDAWSENESAASVFERRIEKIK